MVADFGSSALEQAHFIYADPDYRAKYEELFVKHHPLLAYILKGSKIEKSTLKGPYREFTVVTGGPGQGTGLPTGSETLASTRRNVGLRGREYAYRYIYHFAIPGKDLAEASGEQDYARLIDNYPNLAIADAKEIYARQTMRGSGTLAVGRWTRSGSTSRPVEYIRPSSNSASGASPCAAFSIRSFVANSYRAMTRALRCRSPPGCGWIDQCTVPETRQRWHQSSEKT